MPEALAALIEKKLGLKYVEGYGMSETMAATHANPPDRPKRQCLGIPVFDVDSRIVDPITLHELPRGEIGEIVVHGPQVMLGYWHQPQATEEAFIQIDGKRFLRTGDLGLHRRRGLLLLRRPAQAHDQRGRLQGVAGGGRGAAVPAPGDPRGLRDRVEGSAARRDREGAGGAQARPTPAR